MATILKRDVEMADAVARDSGASTAEQAPKSTRWRRVQLGSGSVVPSPRSGHAMTVIPPTNSVLLFGGANGREFFDDFHLLEPVQYAAMDKTASSQSSGDATLVWKKLVVSYTVAQCSPTFLSTSFGSDASSDNTASQQEDPSTGCGRDYHTMHYVPAPPEQEKQRGFRVLVVGNAIVAAEDGDDDGSVADNDENSFESDELRVDEAWIKQPLLEAQWAERPIKCMWKPLPRNGHCSALLGDQLFCFGGKNATATAFYNDLFYFDVVVNQWRELPPIAGEGPSPRTLADMAVCPRSEKLIVYGGHDRKQQFGGLHVYDVKLNRWDKVLARGEKPATRINHSLTFIAPNQLLLFGGRTRTTRRNDAFIFNMSNKKWRSMSASSETSSQRTTSTSTNTAPSDSTEAPPIGRTAHAAVVYQDQFLVFGGYAGSHNWLNDLHVLPLHHLQPPPSAKTSFVRQDEAASSDSLRETAATTRTAIPAGQTSSSQGHSESTSDSRPSSRTTSDSAQVLSDITNLAPPPVLATSASSRAFLNAVSTSSERSSSEPPPPAYTPAAVAARKRRLAEMAQQELKTASSQTKQRRRPSSSDSTSQGRSQHSPQLPLSPPDAVGIQTMFVQLLQHQQRTDENMARLASVVTSAAPSRQQQHDAAASQQVFLRKQNDLLEGKLDVLTRRYEALEQKVQVLEQDKRQLQEQLVAAETEVYMHKKNMEELLPKVGGHIHGAVERATQAQLKAASMIEAKISNLHDLVEEIRNASGSCTDADDSPQKRDSMFPDESSGRMPLTAPTVLYPQTVVRDLEKKLHDAVQDNHELLQRVAVLEHTVKRYEDGSKRMQELSMWMCGESEETKESEATTTKRRQ